MGLTRHSNTNIPENNCLHIMYIIIKICFYEKLIIPVAKVPVILHVNVSIVFENVIHILLDSADFLIQIHITFAGSRRYCLLIHIVIFYIL